MANKPDSSMHDRVSGGILPRFLPNKMSTFEQRHQVCHPDGSKDTVYVKHNGITMSVCTWYITLISQIPLLQHKHVTKPSRDAPTNG